MKVDDYIYYKAIEIHDCFENVVRDETFISIISLIT